MLNPTSTYEKRPFGKDNQLYQKLIGDSNSVNAIPKIYKTI
jgi:hypothetical protein